MPNSIDADDYMSKNPVTFTEATDIFDAIHMLITRKVSGGTVLNEHNEVIGVLSEIDCLKAIVNTGYYHEGGGTVSDFMHYGDIDFMNTHCDIIGAAESLIKLNRRRMPILKDGKFIGQISARSLLQAFQDSLITESKNPQDK